ncbi:MAG: hypothetical protein JXA77_19075 [Bacteroidales bacterium]|nr:hypothetical protein [Bacteroidales bacterium]MBN2821393.1 hypothetical protein [Bacteroidales bacterium]
MPASEVNKKDVQIAQDFASDFFNTQNKGEYYEFRDNVSYGVKKDLNKGNQKAASLQMKEEIGDFQGLMFVETWISEGGHSFQIFRFKADFEKSEEKFEIRVTINDSKKISGILLLPWSDTANL